MRSAFFFLIAFVLSSSSLLAGTGGLALEGPPLPCSTWLQFIGDSRIPLSQRIGVGLWSQRPGYKSGLVKASIRQIKETMTLPIDPKKYGENSQAPVAYDLERGMALLRKFDFAKDGKDIDRLAKEFVNEFEEDASLILSKIKVAIAAVSNSFEDVVALTFSSSPLIRKIHVHMSVVATFGQPSDLPALFDILDHPFQIGRAQGVSSKVLHALDQALYDQRRGGTLGIAPFSDLKFKTLEDYETQVRSAIRFISARAVEVSKDNKRILSVNPDWLKIARIDRRLGNYLIEGWRLFHHDELADQLEELIARPN